MVLELRVVGVKAEVLMVQKLESVKLKLKVDGEERTDDDMDDPHRRNKEEELSRCLTRNCREYQLEIKLRKRFSA